MKKIVFVLSLITALTASADQARVTPIDLAVTRGEWKQAIALAEDWVDDAPDDALAHYWHAVALRTKMEKVSRLRAMASIGGYKESLARSIELDPELLEPRMEQIGYLIHAPGIAGGDRERAAEEIDALRELDPESAATMMVELASAENDPQAIQAAIEELEALDPERPDLQLRKGLVLIGQQQYREGDGLLASAAESDDPGVALGALYQRARWRIVAEREPDVAVGLLEEFLERRTDDGSSWAPDRAAAYWRLGLAQEQTGDIDAALASVERSVELNDDFDPAKQDLKRLRRRN